MKKMILAEDLKLGKSRERAFASVNGELTLNASNKKDLLMQGQRLMAEMSAAAQRGEDVVAHAHEAETRIKDQKARYEAVCAAFESKSQLEELGNMMGQELYITGNRDGFARRFLILNTLGRGQWPHYTMRQKNVVATVATSIVDVHPQYVRDNEYFPAEFDIEARVFIAKRDLDRTNADVLQEKYIEATEGIMVAEDRMWRQLANETVGSSNELTLVSGSMTPLALANFRNKVTRWGIPAAYWLISNDLWADITADTGFQSVIDPVSKYELLKTGVLGTVLGLQVITDAYRHPEHKVIDRGEMWIIGAAINHGGMTDRGGIDVEPLSMAIEKKPGKGWHMSETISMLIANDRSIAKGIRS